jgi:hypothetical protein
MKNTLVVGIVIGLILALPVVFFLAIRNSSETSTETVETTDFYVNDVVTIESYGEQPNQEVLFTNLYRGEGQFNTFSENIDSPQSLIFTTQEEFKSFWSDVFGTTLTRPLPVVDFDNQIALALMTEQKTTQGYMLTITSLQNSEGKVLIDATEKGPGNGCTPKQTPTRPIHIVAIGKLDTSAVDTVFNISPASGAPCKIQLN